MPHTPGGTKVLLDPTTVGPTLRGAARSRTLQEGPSLLWVDREPKTNYGSHTARSGQEPHTPGGTEVASVDLGTLRRHHGLWVWLTTCARGLADPLGRFCDTMREARGLLSGSCVW